MHIMGSFLQNNIKMCISTNEKEKATHQKVNNSYHYMMGLYINFCIYVLSKNHMHYSPYEKTERKGKAGYHNVLS